MHCQLGEHQAQCEGHPTDQFVQRQPVFQMYHGNRDGSKLPQLTGAAGATEGKWGLCVPVFLFIYAEYQYEF